MPFRIFDCYWTQLKCRGSIPCPRSDHAAVVVEGSMYIFGGRNERGQCLGDLLAFDIERQFWFKFEDAGSAPSPRSSLCMSSHGSKVYVFGGESDNLSEKVKDEMRMIYTLDTTKLNVPRLPIYEPLEF